VENAITHGIASLEEGGMIHITGKALGEQVYLSIKSSGILALDCKDGVGTREAKQRLELLYGQRSSFSIFQLDEANVLVEIHLPQHHIPNDTLPT
jgi:LytS/YehU family sensor histidine kinase